jgi:hypothetical protein
MEKPDNVQCVIGLFWATLHGECQGRPKMLDS